MTAAEKKKLEEWASKKNVTPTFDLEPVEKADMSPFLIHLTGKDSLIQIIKGAGSPLVRDGWGYLKSGIPPYAESGSYHCPVVCFTDSPIFALDFFRYRSSKRFFADQQYGIGFSKSAMVSGHGVRPVLYLDRKTNANLLKIIHIAESSDLTISEEPIQNTELRNTLKEIKPLLFPMFEHTTLQGYMWEREWRYPDSEGLKFNHNEIKIICCPKEERQEIEAALGQFAQQVEIVENWKEYDELKSYLESRGVDILEGRQVEDIQEIIELSKFKYEVEQIIFGLIQFKATFNLSSSAFNEAYVDDKLAKLYDFHCRIELQIEMISSFETERNEEIIREFLQEQSRDMY